MKNTAHTPGKQCDECEGFCLIPRSPLGRRTEAEQVAMLAASVARDAVLKAIGYYRAAGFGSYVTMPLTQALREIEYSIFEVRQ